MQAGIINDEITRLKAKHNKPVYAVVEETCASAAYYIAAAADEIFVTRPASSAALVSSWMVSVLPAPWKSWAWSVACSQPGKQGFSGSVQPQTEQQRTYASSHAEPNPPAVHCRGGPGGATD